MGEGEEGRHGGSAGWVGEGEEGKHGGSAGWVGEGEESRHGRSAGWVREGQEDRHGGSGWVLDHSVNTRPPCSSGFNRYPIDNMLNSTAEFLPRFNNYVPRS